MRKIRWFGRLLLGSLLMAGCADSGGSGFGDPANPKRGATVFVSADDSRGSTAGRSPGLDNGPVPAPEAGEGANDGGDERTVEEGDVYRTFGQRKLLNLNPYRGLQVVDLSDLAAPAIIGRLEMSGTPVELYTSGDRAYVLMNDWQGYWGSRDDIAVQAFSGGVVLSVDLTDPTNPRIVDREIVPGWIYKSRLVKGGGQEALYIVAQDYGNTVDSSGATTWTTTTRVKSFAVAAGQLAPAGELDLGGWISDIAATPEALLVARSDWRNGNDQSLVSLVDISNPDGTMSEGGEIRTEGRVASQFNMDLRGDILRIVSGRSWSRNTNANSLEIFDVSDWQTPVRIDHETFGENEDLFATLFLENSAFFVTYFRTDPFHAFSITDAGDATEMSEFIVSGWNDFFRSTFLDTRLVGIGTNDVQGRTMAVSLYDITNLSNPNPLIARAEVAADNSWSEASWDHRAFSVLEDAVAVQAGNITETGLVLLPFSGWNANTSAHTAGVQIYTFSENTLTRRGVMNHGSPVVRSFQPRPATAANLSQQSLSLFDIADPAQPAELSRLDLAPDYSAILPFGSHAIRVKAPDQWNGWYGQPQLPIEVQVIERTAHADAATPIATFELPGGTSLYRVGTHLLAGVHSKPVDTSRWPYIWETSVQIVDLQNPAQPALRGKLTTRAIQPNYGYGNYYGMVADCIGCGGYDGWNVAAGIHVAGDALAFVNRLPEEDALGIERVCHARAAEPGSCADRGFVDGCTLIQGSETCRTLDGSTACAGGFASCTYSENDGFDCTPIDGSLLVLERHCQDAQATRRWERFQIQLVDVSNPDVPTIRAITSNRNEEAVSVLARGSDLWLNYKVPYRIPGDARPYVRFFGRRIGLANPAQPVVGSGINLPGQLLEIDGSTLFTRNQVWGQTQIEAAVARVRLDGGVAVLEGHRRFPDQVVATVALDGAGHILVSHRAGWNDYGYYGYYDGYGYYGSGQARTQQLTILDAASSQLTPIATTQVDSWATLQDARAGRALFQVPGGLLVFNLDDATAPWPQAFFATKGWPREITVDGRTILFAAGPFGIYEFDLDESNLLTP